MDYKGIFEHVISNILEQFTYSFIEKASIEEMDINDTTYIRAKLRIWGPRELYLILFTSQGLCLEFAANALGMDPGQLIGQGKEKDILGEVLNMVAGNFVTEAFGTQEEFHLDIPEASEEVLESFNSMATDVDTIIFNVEEEPLLACIQIKE